VELAAGKDQRHAQQLVGHDLEHGRQVTVDLGHALKFVEHEAHGPLGRLGVRQERQHAGQHLLPARLGG
jgi:hypothetical protein